MKIFKILINSFLILFLLFSQFGIANAFGPKVPSLNPVKAMDELLGEFGIKKTTVKNMGQMAENITSKITPPEVTLSFTPPNPKSGEKVTVSAMPIYFLNQPDKLYYTWFLKTANCYDRELDGNDYRSEYPEEEFFADELQAGESVTFEHYENNKCNLDGDNDVDIEDYKIKAMRIIANDGFNWKKEDIYTVTSHDDDEYEASFGGDDQNGKEAQCFVHDIKTGGDFAIDCDDHLFPDAPPSHETGGNDNSFGVEEERFWHTDPQSKDTGHTGKTDETNVCGLGINNFTWDFQKGDQIGLVAEGTATIATQTEDSSYKTMWAMSRKNYEVARTTDTEALNTNTVGEPVIESDSTDDTGTRTVKYITTTDSSAFIPDSVSGDLASVDNITQKTLRETTYHDTGFIDETTTTTPPYTGRTYAEMETTATLGVIPGPVVPPTITTDGETSNTILLSEDEYKAYYSNVLSGDTPENVPVLTSTTTTETTTTQTTVSRTITNSYPDPDDPTVTLYDFTISETPATRVVTESEELSDEPLVVNQTTSTNPVESELSNSEISDDALDSVSDLNNFLYKALVDPSINETSSQKLEVEISYLPAMPINDPSSDPKKNNGDTLSAIATIVNPQDNAFLNYTWEAWQNDIISTDPGDWTQIPENDPDQPIDLNRLKASPVKGLGLDEFEFKLSLPKTYTDLEGIEKNLNFIQLRLNVKENIDAITREGNASVIIPIESSSGEISVSNANIDSSTYSLSPGDQILPEENKTYQVIKNNIISLSFANDSDPAFDKFLWTIDGETIAYTECPFPTCDETQRDAYFPITKEVGEKYTINLVATNDLGDKINLTKIFEVVEPTIKIEPATDDTSDNCSRIKLGEYIGMIGTDGNTATYPDYSEESLLSATGSSIRIRAFVDGFSPLDNSYTWSVNENTFLGNSELVLLAKETAGENYTVSVSTTYLPSNATKKALNTYWGLSFGDFYEKIISDNVEIVIQDTALVASEKSPQKIFASLFTSTPEYLAFLLRIVFTTFLIIFVSKLIFTFSPRARE